ncbi:GNAT family N-acetyltransferase [Sphingobacterium arenae]|uniref:GNAT family N-acetyltransferase n=1 Tax=Sphingobacterium arenae TaxID=1280598 RepID=A0ABR7XYF6_9SPHI|nr:GNAT family N-acetyltransferase [Sphingobacterium arenae]MBD1424062.1 GNAT family N-acetyltransferase [Sphingobacterium arenae]
MIKADPNDKTLITELLAKSFEKNLSVNYIIRQDEKKAHRLRVLMEYSIKMCSLFGEIWLSNDKKACALVLYPHKKKTTFATIYLDVKLALSAIGISGIGKAIKREAMIKKKQPKEKMAYLWFIGVNPLYQHLGIGSNLLKEVLANATKNGLPVYLETSTQKNLPWYQRFGFRIYDKLVLSYVLHFLKHEPAK